MNKIVLFTIFFSIIMIFSSAGAFNISIVIDNKDGHMIIDPESFILDVEATNTMRDDNPDKKQKNKIHKEDT